MKDKQKYRQHGYWPRLIAFFFIALAGAFITLLFIHIIDGI